MYSSLGHDIVLTPTETGSELFFYFFIFRHGIISFINNYFLESLLG